MNAVLLLLALAPAMPPVNPPPDFNRDVRPMLAERCFSCHGPDKQRGNLRLDLKAAALKGGDSGPALVPGKSADSLIVKLVSGGDTDRVMPPKGERLSATQMATLQAWIDAGAVWPDDKAANPRDWWSLKPLARPAVPARDPAWGRNAVDAFVLAKLREKGLSPSPEADRRTLIRRLAFDLTGLPPTLEEVEAFVADQSPDRYEKLVDRLLASPGYGERWGRHWLDVVHYGDTHGYDKDKVRPNAWPYRDYVIHSLNDDKPYERFLREQLAGDVLYPETGEGIVATGFIAAGPWDFVGHVELGEGKLDKEITRNLDRDDMAATALNTFAGLTVQCARCHDHKFDPVSQEDYYRTQAVFAAVDRADRPYDTEPRVAQQRETLRKRLAEATARRSAAETPGEKEISTLRQAMSTPGRPEHGYHSKIEAADNAVKWVQIDLGESKKVDAVLLAGCHDTFAGIGDGFGFPVRFKVEVCDDETFAKDVQIIADETEHDVPNPGVVPVAFAARGKSGRFVRVTATKLAPRQNDFIFALGELAVLDEKGKNLAIGAPVSSLDSIEAGPRWTKKNLTDGLWHLTKGDRVGELARLLLKHRPKSTELDREVRALNVELGKLSTPRVVYAAATDFAPAGNFTATKGVPRKIHLLHRGSEKSPKQEVGPGALSMLPELAEHFRLPEKHAEGQRRAALAEWLADRRNPLTWRVMVNRVWQYHFGKGIVDTPNDFGRMGGKPTHPELLDWLAVEFRDSGQSLKTLHRLIVLSSTYRQVSTHREDMAKLDAGNQFLWRFNRQRMEAEAVRDAVLAVAGKLDRTVGGPGFRAFGFVDDHSPHYKYDEANPDDPATHRRSVYRFLVRSVPDPFFETLDCADPSAAVAKRNETLTALQALALLNNKFMVRMAEHVAARVEKQADDVAGRVDAAVRLVLCRSATRDERELLTKYAQKHGLSAMCRLLLNTNEFVFVD